MTVAALLQRLTRNLTVRSVTDMPAGESTRVFDALNDAVREWFEMAPPEWKRNTTSALIQAPLQISITVTQNGTAFTLNTSFPAGGYAAAADLVGKALLIAGESSLNRIQSSGELLKPYLGATGTVTATVYCDTVPFASSDWRIDGDPLWRGEGMFQSRRVTPWMGVMNIWMEPLQTDRPVPVYFGTPLWYWTGSHQPSLSQATPYWYLYLWPLPATVGTLLFTKECVPPAYNIADLQTQRDVPIPDAYIPTLVQRSQLRLISSPLWRKDASVTAAAADGQAALETLQRLTAQGRDTAARPCGTPSGF